MNSERLKCSEWPIALAGAIFIASGCGSPYPDVVFNVPDGFRGPFVLIEDPVGVDIKQEGRSFTIDVPSDRVLKVRSASVLHDWAHESARWHSGNPLPIGEYVDLPMGEAAALWSSGYGIRNGETGRYEFFVGSKAEFEAFDFDAYDHNAASGAN